MKRLMLLIFWLLMFALPFSPLCDAARNGDVTQIKNLVAKGADLNEPSGGNQWTPLMHAIHKNQIASVGALLDLRANPNFAAPSGVTPLMMAAGYGQIATVQLLLKRGADAKLTDRKGESALDYALTSTADIDDFTLMHCQDQTARALIAAGAKAKASSVRFARMKGCVTPR